MNEPKVFLIHGFGGEPNGGWRPWLMGKLARENVWAAVPAMPTPENPKKEEWVKEIARAIGESGENVYLVGHSLGVCAVLHYLETLKNAHVGGCLLVSGPIHELSGDRYRPIDNFMNQPFDFDHIKSVCSKFTIIHGDNDKNVPISHAEELAQALGCELISIPNGGHLNGSSGWYELPEAFTVLMNWLKPKT